VQHRCRSSTGCTMTHVTSFKTSMEDQSRSAASLAM